MLCRCGLVSFADAHRNTTAVVYFQRHMPISFRWLEMTRLCAPGYVV